MRYLLFLCIVFICYLIANSNKEVLLIHSYHKGYAWSDEISKSIENNFSKHKNIELTTIYMDSKRVDNRAYLESLANLYKEQFSKREFDLILVCDNNAFDFIAKYYNYLFKNTPVLFCGDKQLHTEEFREA